MIQIAYTNSNCSDLWSMFQNQNKKYTTIPVYMISDKDIDGLHKDKLFIYNNEDAYYNVWVKALQSFNSDYFIYLQEDFILYNDVDYNKVNDYLEILKKNPEYSFVRLIRSGELKQKRIVDNLYEIESTNPNIFSMQATIWRTKDYISLMEQVKDSKWLENDKYPKKMIEMGIKGLYHYDGEKKRGENHYDSNVYPYIATALVRGKWNTKEYPEELGKILEEYNINISDRGELWF
jgi:hypothetical protein